jgi:hypothetical protein
LVELAGERDRWQFGRVRGSVLAGVVAVVAAPLVAAVGLAVLDQVLGSMTGGVDLAGLAAWTTLAILSAGIGGLTVAPIVKGSTEHAIWEVVLMTLVTYLSAVMLAPIVISVAALPRALNGWDVPCNGLSHYQFQSPSGLHGLPALDALIGGAMETYALTIVAELLFLPLLVLLLIASALLDGLVRREIRKHYYQRS